MRQLKSVDAMWLAVESPRVATHVSALLVVDQATTPRECLTLERMREVVSERLSRAAALRWRLVQVPFGLDHGYWIEDPDFALEHHTHAFTLPRPGSEGQLRAHVSRLFERPLDRRRPLWELHLIQGLERDRAALFVKIHHSVADGFSAAQILVSLLDGDKAQTPVAERRRRPEPKRPPRPAPSAVEMLGRGLVGAGRQPLALRSLPRALASLDETPLLRNIPGAPAVARLARAAQRRPWPGSVDSLGRADGRRVPRTPFSGRLSSRRRIALQSLPLPTLEAVKEASGATVNDVVVAVSAAALRRWLLDCDRLPAEPLVAVVPVSVRSEGQRDHGNRVSGMVVPIPTNEADPWRRLLRVREGMAAAKARHRTLPTTLFEDAAELVPPALLPPAARLATALTTLPGLPSAANLTIANITGPQTPLHFAGAVVEAAYPIAPIADGMGLNVSATSYRGQLFVGIVADPGHIPDVQPLADWMREALDELRALSSPRGRRRALRGPGTAIRSSERRSRVEARPAD